MNQLFRFLRNLDKRKLIFILQRASAILLPIRLMPNADGPTPVLVLIKRKPFRALPSAAKRPV